jgi:diaminohydroxyphosphoribosylaminopyrimidine deaminase/5-amino-6-(5-phosphoribosylamino)uracil reductase
MSLDGRIATHRGNSRWITSSRSRAAGGEARWARDAILVGLGTVRADDPLLTARRGGRIKPGFVRVILDSQLRLPTGSRLVRSARRSPVRVYALRSAPATRERRLRRAGVEVVRVRARDGRVDPRSVLEDLGANEVTSILLEGGGEVNASFLAAGLVDKVLLFVAPTFLGGRDAVPVVGGKGVALPSEAFRLAHWEAHRLGPDLLIEGYPSRRK